MDNLQFHTGGFPLEIPTLEFLQEQTKMVTMLSALGGSDTYILSGVITQGANVTDGYIVYKGEVLPFKGSAKQAKVTIIETQEKVIYKADDNGDGLGDEKLAYVKRIAKFGTNGVETFDFSILKPFIEGVGGQIFKTFFKDVRLPYIGAIEDIPVGWELCEVLSGYFPVIYDPNNPDYNVIGKTGGTNDVTLTEAQMPKHSHNGTTSEAGVHTHTGSADSAGSHAHAGATENGGSHKHTGSTYSAGSHKHNLSIGKHHRSFDGESASDHPYKTNAGIFVNLETNSAGSHSHTLNMTNAGEHNHSITTDSAGSHTHDVTVNEGGNHSHTVTTENKGGNQPHENRPLHKVIALIKWIGV
ncbi:hypothetical protein PL373_07850 [Tenacibaculum maritimum]|nr:hypothetical protein [Tenacibaculum maritimum]MDB0601058.1 hypothetical protein [Tenacibaculum maritimum]MDB0611830.1 hypothetical protein [Tenacibaculum maritimum]